LEKRNESTAGESTLNIRQWIGEGHTTCSAPLEHTQTLMLRSDSRVKGFDE